MFDYKLFLWPVCYSFATAFQTSAVPSAENGILDWLLLQAPTVVVLGLVLWATYLQYKEERKYNKELVKENIELMTKVVNVVENMKEELKKNEERNEKLQQMLIQLSSIIEKNK